VHPKRKPLRRDSRNLSSRPFPYAHPTEEAPGASASKMGKFIVIPERKAQIVATMDFGENFAKATTML